MKWARHNDGAPYQFVAWPVDWKFLRTMGIGIIEGRDFKETDGDVCIINEAFKRKCPDIIELGKPLDGGELPILGVCRNFRASTVRTDCNTEPLAFIIFGERNAGWGNQTRILYVRTAPHADRKTMRTEVSRTLETFYDDQATTPEVKCYDDILEQTYKDEMRFMAQTAVSTLLAFLITVIGVFCLTLFETEYRRKEIAIRRVMGSSVSEVLSLFAMRYAVPLIIAFLIAAPLATASVGSGCSNLQHTPPFIGGYSPWLSASSAQSFSLPSSSNAGGWQRRILWKASGRNSPFPLDGWSPTHIPLNPLDCNTEKSVTYNKCK